MLVKNFALIPQMASECLFNYNLNITWNRGLLMTLNADQAEGLMIVFIMPKRRCLGTLGRIELFTSTKTYFLEGGSTGVS